jgi:hypothetical protein
MKARTIVLFAPLALLGCGAQGPSATPDRAQGSPDGSLTSSPPGQGASSGQGATDAALSSTDEGGAGSNPDDDAANGGGSSGAGLLDAGADSSVLYKSLPPPPDPCIDAGTCPAGAWVNVTPSGVRLDPNYPSSDDNYGVLDVVVDPLRPSDLYAFICYQGVWKSTDYGLTWKKVDTGTNASNIDGGRPWTAAIDPNPHRDPTTPPTIYTVDGYGNQLGVYKSTDGGVNWSYYAVNNTQGTKSSDVYSLDIDPYNSNHLIAGFHDVGMSESKDGGQTWATISVPSNFGISVYVWFVQSSAASTTSGTWLTQAQWNKNNNGMWRTTNSGATWTQVQSMLEHIHGSAQIYQDGHGAIYASGNAGQSGNIFRSTDYGQTWTAAKSGKVAQNDIFATPNYFYATNPYATTSNYPQHLQRSPASDGVNWSDWNPTAPTGMTNGAKRAAVTYDGQHYVIVSGNWDAGIWRYVE